MSVNYMMAKDSVKKRLDTGMSFMILAFLSHNVML